jgi:hypothetical protein
VPLVEQELLTLPGHASSPPVFSGVRVTRSLVFCVMLIEKYKFFILKCDFKRKKSAKFEIGSM